MKIIMPKSKAIVSTAQGKLLRRRLKINREPENIPMYPYEIASRLSDLSLLDFSFHTVPKATTADFDVREISRKDVCELLILSKDQAYRLLKKLVRKDRLYVIGTGVKTKYMIKE